MSGSETVPNRRRPVPIEDVPVNALMRLLEFMPRPLRETMLDTAPAVVREEVALFLVIQFVRHATLHPTSKVVCEERGASHRFDDELAGYMASRGVAPKQLLQDDGRPLRSMLEQKLGPAMVWLPCLGPHAAWISLLASSTFPSSDRRESPAAALGELECLLLGAKIPPLESHVRKAPTNSGDAAWFDGQVCFDLLTVVVVPSTTSPIVYEFAGPTNVVIVAYQDLSLPLPHCVQHLRLRSSSITSTPIALLKNSPSLVDANVTAIDLSGLTVKKVDDGFLSSLPLLVSITAPGKCSLGDVGDDFAAHLPSLTDIDLGSLGITSIGHNALVDAGALERVDLGGLTLQSVGDQFLSRCPCLTAIEASAACSLGTVGKKFGSETAVSTVDLTLIYMQAVGSHFLSACGALRHVIMGPRTIEVLGDYSFSGCPRLETITSSSTTRIDSIGDYFATDRAGGGCPRLTHVDMDRIKVTKAIGNSFLWGCSALKAIDLGGVHVEAVGHRFLANCTHLQDIVATGEGCRLGDVGSQFASAYNGAGCPLLCRVDLLKLNLSRIGDAFLSNCDSVTSIDFGGLSLSKIGNGCLADCKHLTSLTASRACDLGEVGSNFCCRASLVSVNLQHFAIRSVGDNFFAHCPNLQDINLGTIQCHSVGDYFVAACPNLETISAEECTLGSVGNHFAAALQRGFGSSSKLVSIDLPRMHIQRRIGSHFLWKCTLLRSVDLSGIAVDSTGPYFLADCASLTEIVAPGKCRLGDVGSYFASPFNTGKGPTPDAMNFRDITISTIDDVFVSLCPQLVQNFLDGRVS